jgi:hypothetical protein
MTRFLLSTSVLAMMAVPALSHHHAGTTGYALSANGVSHNDEQPCGPRRRTNC